MSASRKRSFSSFVKSPPQPTAVEPSNLVPSANSISQIPNVAQEPDASIGIGDEEKSREFTMDRAGEQEPPAGKGREAPPRTQVVTPTGRVRTYTASRNLPGVTYRMTENRWERLKMLSIQERRPIQEILGEALQDYMRRRGLPW